MSHKLIIGNLIIDTIKQYSHRILVEKSNFSSSTYVKSRVTEHWWNRVKLSLANSTEHSSYIRSNRMDKQTMYKWRLYWFSNRMIMESQMLWPFSSIHHLVKTCKILDSEFSCNRRSTYSNLDFNSDEIYTTQFTGITMLAIFKIYTTNSIQRIRLFEN